MAALLLIRLDPLLMSWRYRLIEKEPSGGFKQILVGLRDFGQIVPITVAVVIVFLSDRRRGLVVGAILLAQLLGAMTYNPLKWAVSRYRPIAVVEDVAKPRFSPFSQPDGSLSAAEVEAREGRLYADLLQRISAKESWQVPSGPRSADHESFPSGHSGAAFALAAVLAWFYPHLRGVFWTLAAGCAVSRVVDGAHWPSDCLVGAVIGYCAAWLSLNVLQRIRSSASRRTPSGIVAPHPLE